MEQLKKVSSLGEIYSANNTQRYVDLSQAFEKLYSQKPQFFSRAPGRVNLIGEHIDYMGYGVLPFALEVDCVIAVARIPQLIISIAQVDGDIYPQQNLPTDSKEQPEFKNNYIKYIWAGFQAALETTGSSQLGFGLQLLVSGNVPLSAGLSSSSSLVVCSGAAFINSINMPINQHDFVNNLIKYERLAGTACGGMDQSISALGKRGQALYIQFNPLRLQEVKLPQGYVFVIANSLTPSTKLETLGTRYNKRVCECRIALLYLCKALQVSSEGLTTLAQLQDLTKFSIESMISVIDLYIEDREYSFSEIEEYSQQSLRITLQDIPQLEAVLTQNSSFSLNNRAKHVFQEAARVLHFKEVCDSNICDGVKSNMLGKLMNESQKSCALQYQCSSEQINILTATCLRSGALGSRLTGAGWGGCTVSLVKEDQATEFVSLVQKEYYEVLGAVLKDSIFISQPSNGACAIDYDYILQ